MKIILFLVKTPTKVEQVNKMPKGEHFAALKEPDLWIKEITSFFYK